MKRVTLFLNAEHECQYNRLSLHVRFYQTIHVTRVNKVFKKPHPQHFHDVDTLLRMQHTFCQRLRYIGKI